jgi:hypothetical protein
MINKSRKFDNFIFKIFVFIFCSNLFILLVSLNVFAVLFLEIDSPNTGNFGMPVNFEFNVLDQDGVKNMTYDYGDGDVQTINCNSELSCSYGDSKSFYVEKTYVVTLSAYSSNGNYQEITKNIVIQKNNYPEISLDKTSIQTQKNQLYSFYVNVGDLDSDLSTLFIYENDILYESVPISGSSFTKNYQFTKTTSGEYDYRIEVYDSKNNKATKSVLVNVESEIPIIDYFIVNSNYINSNSEININLGSSVRFEISSSGSQLSILNLGFTSKLCNNQESCLLSETKTFDELGTFSYYGYSQSSQGEKSSNSATITINVVCPNDYSCCNPGESEWLAKPRNKNDGCNGLNKYIEYSCDYNNIIETQVGTDFDRDGFDYECGDCDDNNKFIFPDNSNLFCDCDLKLDSPKQSEHGLCSDTIDNDCDGKIDCFDENCPSYDPQNCKIECPTGYTKCSDGSCVNLNMDLNNCGLCGFRCSGPTNRIMSCDFGVCLIDECKLGFGDCDSSSRDCETNLLDDNENCGSCGNLCPSTHICSNGICTRKQNLENDVSLDCVYGESIACISKKGCVGIRSCLNNNKYSDCICEPYLKLISPNNDLFSSNIVYFDIDTNYVLDKCFFKNDNDEISVINQNKFSYYFKSGKHDLSIKCYNDEVNTQIHIESSDDLSNINFKNIEINPLYSKLKNEFNPNDYRNNIDNFDITKGMKYDQERYHIYVNYELKKSFEDVKFYFQIPDCSNLNISDINFYNSNYKKIDDKNIIFEYELVKNNLLFIYDVPNYVDESCLNSFATVFIAQKSYYDFNFKNLIYFLVGVLIFMIITSIIFEIYKKIKYYEETEEDEIRNIVDETEDDEKYVRNY